MRAFDAMRQSRKPVDLGRVQALELLDAALGADRRQLIKQYVENYDTSAKLAERIWQAIYDLSQGFIFAYQTALEEALPSRKPDRIAGVGGLATRHGSMAAGELGADYVLFGEPDASGQRPSVEAIAERLQWWDELFEPPCIGFAVSREEAFEFASAGADFVLVGDFIWAAPRGAKAALIDAGEAIRQAHQAAFGTAKAGRG